MIVSTRNRLYMRALDLVPRTESTLNQFLRPTVKRWVACSAVHMYKNKDQNIEELADLLEVLFAAAEARGYSAEELERVRAIKTEERGAFKKRILLKEVE